MRKFIYILLFAAACVLQSCSTVSTYNPKTGKYETKFVSGGLRGMFADVVQKDIQSELRGDNVDTTWQDFWIDWCATLYYNPDLGDCYIQYIIDKRREASLPDIPEIDKRQFKSEWQYFTDNVDKQTDREIKGFPPPYSTNRATSAWLEYWKIINEQALHNSALSTNGVEYINNRRKQMGLPSSN